VDAIEQGALGPRDVRDSHRSQNGFAIRHQLVLV
jgi:hypothetical protein